MDIPNKKTVEPPEPVKKAPVGESMSKIALAIGFQIPTWIEDRLYDAEFARDPQRVVDMFNTLGAKVEALAATGDDENATITFEFWRLPKKGAKKRKPIQLDATLYQHPDYDSFWMHLTYAS